jgi:NAD dependent epimerase/dehydratase family enzyme
MLLPSRLGAGGRVGSGRQWWSWIVIDDLAAAYRRALEGDMAGVYNLTTPNPVRNAEFTKALGRALHRPTVLPAPTIGLRVLFGKEATEQAVLSGQRVLPARLEAEGFQWLEPELDGALERALAA